MYIVHQEHSSGPNFQSITYSCAPMQPCATCVHFSLAGATITIATSFPKLTMDNHFRMDSPASSKLHYISASSPYYQQTSNTLPPLRSALASDWPSANTLQVNNAHRKDPRVQHTRLLVFKRLVSSTLVKLTHNNIQCSGPSCPRPSCFEGA